MSFSRETKNQLLEIAYERSCCRGSNLSGLELDEQFEPPAFICPECGVAFLAGVFISSGTVTSPDSAYHLELVMRSREAAELVIEVCSSFGVFPKMTVRSGKNVLYLRDSVEVEDFLAQVGAPQSSLSIMEVKVMREVRNNLNRRTNCDTANIFKTTSAAALQVKAIEALKSSGKLDELEVELQITARLRLENPLASLAELVELHPTAITKSGLNHRLKRIVAMME